MMNFHASSDRTDVRQSTRRALLSLPLTFVILLSLVAVNVQASSPSRPDGMQTWASSLQQKGSGNALFAVSLNGQAQLAQLETSGLVFYSNISSNHGDYLLVGATPEVAGRLGTTLRLLDTDTTGASYFLVHPPVRATTMSWTAYGRVLLELGDQVLLRTTPGQPEQLIESGVEIAYIDLQPQPWPEPQAEAMNLLAISPDTNIQAMLDQVSTSTIYTYTVAISREQGSMLKISGGISVRMTDFKITPPEPTAAGGIIKTGNEVQLSFVWWTRPPKPGSS